MQIRATAKQHAWLGDQRVHVLIALVIVMFSIGSSVRPVSANAEDAAHGALAARCSSIDIPVAILPQRSSIHATLCLPGRHSTTLQVLVPGGTYNGEYWNYPVDPDKHNYVDAAINAGYATLVVNQLGRRGSSYPPSAGLTGSAQAAALHSVVEIARSDLLGNKFAHVVLVGHSVGSIESVMEAATYQDVDGLILTGFSHHFNYPHLLNVFATSLRPAPLVPGYKPAEPSDPGYLTSLPGTRYNAFYAPAPVDPAVLAHDEATKDVFSVAEPLDGVPLAVLSQLTLNIKAPVLVITGAEDSFFCGGPGALDVCATNAKFRESETPYFSPNARLTTHVVPAAGHVLNFMGNSAITFQAMLAWTAGMVAS